MNKLQSLKFRLFARLPTFTQAILYTLIMGNRGLTAGGLISVIIALMIGMILASALLPTAFEDIYAVNTTNWSTSAGNIWDLLPVIAIVALLVIIVGMIKLRGD